MKEVERQNNRQPNSHQQEDNPGGFINKVSETLENMVDTLTGDNKNEQQNG